MVWCISILRSPVPTAASLQTDKLLELEVELNLFYDLVGTFSPSLFGKHSTAACIHSVRPVLSVALHRTVRLDSAELLFFSIGR